MLDLSLRSEIPKVRHWTADVNQLYHPTGVFPQDSESFVYAKDTLSTTKFTEILLKEWLYLVKKDGYLVIDYQPNALCDWSSLEKKMWWLWKKHYEIIYHGPLTNEQLSKNSPKELESFIHNQERQQGATSTVTTPNQPEGYLRFVCKKILTTQLPNDSIEKWSFGIITNGKRLDWIEQIIQSIQDQGIPHYEILICGSYKERKGIRYLPFHQRDDRGWITKKKNTIVSAAKYQNICIIHDRIIFNTDWYSGMKKWGNTFDHLACTQTYNGERINDWEIHEKFPNLEFSFVSLMDYRDWDFDVCQGGQLHISKKKYLQEIPWNESMLWKEPEDLRISNDLRDAGHILRCNPDAGFDVFAYNFGDLPSVPYDSQRLSPSRRGNFGRLLSRRVYQMTYSNPFFKKIALSISDILSKHVYAKS